jgi:hypothetical protein
MTVLFQTNILGLGGFLFDIINGCWYIKDTKNDSKSVLTLAITKEAAERNC